MSPVVQAPKRVSTAVCRAAALRAKAGTILGDGLHLRSLQEVKNDPSLNQVGGRTRKYRCK